MFDATDQILRQLRAGEDSRTEFKELRYGKRGVISPRTENLAAEMVAFANAGGGTLIFGVDDSGAPAGVPRDRLDAVEQWIINVASDLCDPPIRPMLGRTVVPGADGEVTIVLAEVPRGVHVHRTAQGRYHVRVGSTKRDLDRTELARLFQDRGRGFVFDEQPVHAATANDLSRGLLEAHFELSPTIPWPDLLRNTRITSRDRHGVDRPTVAGLLAFSSDTTRHLLSAYIEAACYGGTRLSSDDLVRAERLTGPVSDQIDKGIAFVMHYMRKGRSSRGAPYDIDVVDEAVVNAVAHRDYSVYGSKIRLFLYADRLEVYSPGGLPNGITVDEMPYRTFTRNQLLVSFLSRMRSARTGQYYLESRGEGVRKILEGGEAHSGRRPEYELFGNELRLTVWGRGRNEQERRR